jgi:hypothetical protein
MNSILMLFIFVGEVSPYARASSQNTQFAKIKCVVFAQPLIQRILFAHCVFCSVIPRYPHNESQAPQKEVVRKPKPQL